MQQEPIKIDIRKALTSKMPRYARFIPHFVTNWLSRLVCQDELNCLLAENRGKEGYIFAGALLKDLGITLKVEGEENIPAKDNPVIFVSNHPLGGLDGIALMALLGSRYGDSFRVIVNDLLMHIKPFAKVFLPINKHGAQSRESAQKIDAAFRDGNQIMVFPAGLCSRKLKNGEITDLKWQKSFIRQSLEYHRDVIPIYFDGYNSYFFYRFAKLRVTLGIKFNFDMMLLPREVFKNKNKTFTVRIGRAIPWKTFTTHESMEEQAYFVRQKVYDLKPKY